MIRRQLVLLFIGNMLIFVVANAITALASIYVRDLGASETSTGLYFSISFGALACGAFMSGPMSNRFGNRKHFVTGCATLSIPVVLLLGSARDVVQATLLTSILFLLFGIITAMIDILTGLFAEPHARGRTFGIIAVSRGVGQVIGHSISGPVIEQWGFRGLFTVNAGVYLLLIPISIFLLDKLANEGVQFQKQPRAQQMTMSRLVGLLFAASLFASVVSFANVMLRPLSMEANSLPPSAITSLLAISGLFGLPLPFVFGWLSDQVGRRLGLLLCYALTLGGILVMLPASLFWQFALAQFLITAYTPTKAIAMTLLTDITPRAQLDTTLSRFAALPWVGAVIGFAMTGFALQGLGLFLTYVGAAILAGASIYLVVLSLPAQGGIRTKLATQTVRRAQV